MGLPAADAVCALLMEFANTLDSALYIRHLYGEVLAEVVSRPFAWIVGENPGNRGAPRDELWFGEPVVENGYIQPSNAPGFGVTLNEALQ
ncbi:MAG: hypothetical protein VX947_04345, partial [Chloroflexota bacterium]|nr:hypothetical protein [Chloroflexota bacterium]